MTRFGKKDAPGMVAVAVAVALSLALREHGSYNVGPLSLGPAVLLLGMGSGTLGTWTAGLAAGIFTLVLYSTRMLSLDLSLAALAVQLVCTLFPLPLVEHAEIADADFEAKRTPLDAERSDLRSQLDDVRTRAQAAERRGRETDALFHAGREISKMLTLADTLEFAREVLTDTLSLAGGEGDVSFVLGRLDEEHAAFQAGAWGGMEEAQARGMEHPASSAGLFSYLERYAGDAQVLVAKAAAEPGLKGVALPVGARGFLALPLLIQRQPIGWMVVFDMGQARLEARDFSNLRILCSQIAIGLEKATLYDRLQRLSITDGLTSLTVHRHFQSRLEEEVKRAERYREPLSLIMLDIDHFKRFNDEHGHLVGDAVLKAVAVVLKDSLAAAELAARYGGEEFALVLPKVPKAVALERAQALRLAVKGLAIESGEKSLSVAVSLGVACYPDDAMTKKGLLEAADQALYQSKKRGRDQVTAAPALTGS